MPAEQKVSIGEYLQMFEDNCTAFQRDFEEICDDKAIKYLVGKFCENQIQYTSVLKESFKTLETVGSTSNLNKGIKQKK